MGRALGLRMRQISGRNKAACVLTRPVPWRPRSVFMSVVEERKHLPALKQFLKLYSVRAGAAGGGRGPASTGMPGLPTARPRIEALPLRAPPALQSIPISKLASLAELDTETLKQQLALLKQSTQVRSASAGTSWAGCTHAPLHGRAPPGWDDEARKKSPSFA